MLISGIQQFTVTDYPGKTACVVFTPGCNFRCGFCHNPEFVLPEKIQKIRDSFIPQDAIFRFLATRNGLLDGVVVSGGEPTMMGDLLDFLEEIKTMGFLVKLDTNGNRPDVIEEALSRSVVDYIAMDVKTSFANYQTLVGPRAFSRQMKKTMDLIRESRIPYEFRTTLIKEIHTPDILNDMKEMLAGAAQLFLQSFRPTVTLSPSFVSYHPFSWKEMENIRHNFADRVKCVTIR